VATQAAQYCRYIASSFAARATSFEFEAPILRGAAPLAPATLHNEFNTVLTAYEQIQDREDGAITPDQVTLIGTPQLRTAMATIAAYTVQVCGVHVAQVLPDGSRV
jgi:hypothetical protein